jgi:hypothetical protein
MFAKDEALRIAANIDGVFGLGAKIKSSLNDKTFRRELPGEPLTLRTYLLRLLLRLKSALISRHIPHCKISLGVWMDVRG